MLPATSPTELNPILIWDTEHRGVAAGSANADFALLADGTALPLEKPGVDTAVPAGDWAPTWPQLARTRAPPSTSELAPRLAERFTPELRSHDIARHQVRTISPSGVANVQLLALRTISLHRSPVYPYQAVASEFCHHDTADHLKGFPRYSSSRHALLVYETPPRKIEAMLFLEISRRRKSATRSLWCWSSTPKADRR